MVPDRGTSRDGTESIRRQRRDLALVAYVRERRRQLRESTTVANRRPATDIDTATVEFTPFPAPAPSVAATEAVKGNSKLPVLSLSVAVHPLATAAAAGATTRHIVSVTDAIDADNETLTTTANTQHAADN